MIFQQFFCRSAVNYELFDNVKSKTLINIIALEEVDHLLEGFSCHLHVCRVLNLVPKKADLNSFIVIVSLSKNKKIDSSYKYYIDILCLTLSQYFTAGQQTMYRFT